MATLLYRLGDLSYRHRRLVAALWLALLVAVGVAAATLSKPTNDTFNVPGTEAQRALDLLDERFPGAGGATARIVFAAPEGQRLDAARYRGVVEPTVALAQQVPQSLQDPRAFAGSLTFSSDRRIAFADLHFLAPVADLRESTRDALLRVAEPAERAGLEVAFSGGVTSEAVVVPASAEIIGFGIALVVLLVTFGAFVTAVLPLVTALVGVAIGLLGITATTGLVELNSTAPILATMLGLAVGIDYALFIVSRHRQHLHEGMEPREAAALAVGTAGGAVAFAGITVVIALAGVLVIGIPFLTAMGLAAAGTVVVAVLVALTLLPALLGFAGERVARGRRLGTRETMGARWAERVLRRPLLTSAAVVALLAVVAIPVSGMRLGLPGEDTLPKGTTERRAADLLTEGFGAGFTGPLLVVGDGARAERPRAALAGAARALGDFPGVASVSPPIFNRDGDLAVVTVTPDSGPTDERTNDLVTLIRERAQGAASAHGIDGYVTGRTAINIDTSQKISDGLPAFVLLVVGLALVLMLLVFRSIAVPIKAVAGFLLTLAAALGVTTWVFQDGNLAGLFGLDTPAPLVSFLPVLLVSILFGLAMDYEVFLVSRIRESYVEGDRARTAIVTGFRGSARVVTAAALIMVGVFAAFVQADDTIVKTIAFALAFGVLVDAFLVRMTLVPAVLALLGDRAWHLPWWLRRRLPDIDVEGQRLTRPQR